MYNFRHLAILLTSVFLALGIGIAVGFTANSDEILVKQQQKIIDRLEMDYGMLKIENKTISEELNIIKEKMQEDEKFLETFLYELFSGKFNDNKVAIIQSDNYKDIHDLRGFLEKMGIEIYFDKKFNTSLLAQTNSAEIIQALTEVNSMENYDNSTIPGLVNNFSHIPTDHFIIINADDAVNVVPIINSLLKLNKNVALIQNSDTLPKDLIKKPAFIWLKDIDTIAAKYRLIDFLIKNNKKTFND